MIVLTVCNHKGGTGKTTSVIHIAAALGLSGYKTLVVDLDPQCFLTHMLGVDEPPDICSSAMLFNEEVALRDVPTHSVTNFDLVPSSRALTRLMRRLNQPTDVYWAKESLKEGTDYDIVIFDTAAAVTVYSLNALVASDFVLIPVTPEYQPVVGAEQTVRSAEVVRQRLNPDLHEPYFMFTQVDFRKNSHRTYRQYMRGKYGSNVMRSLIRTSAALADNHADGSTAFDHNPQSRGARDYANATDELLQRMHPPEPQEPAATGGAPTNEDTRREPRHESRVPFESRTVREVGSLIYEAAGNAIRHVRSPQCRPPGSSRNARDRASSCR